MRMKKKQWLKGKLQMTGSYEWSNKGTRFFKLFRIKKNGKKESEIYESWEKAKKDGWKKVS